ncbi:MAG: hypothetical protein A3E78_15685 [Alphaproteobacteria bacterium RIFCSPHIGHO2_12_FULL_63_12]|nr:MAG: hypothetical protein A3E78_15685 [Alphaproteobacteria bacterium RIFCSPHIGHO2_12_FULL_63_12]
MLLQGVFAAAALIFLSATIGVATRNQLLGGLLFAGALSMVGIGVINAVLAGEAAGLLRVGLAAVAAIAIGLSFYAGARGDIAARVILPGAALAAAAPLLFGLGGGGITALAPQAIFAIGILVASLVAVADFQGAAAAPRFSPDAVAQFSAAADRMPDHRAEYAREKALRVSENQLAQVLDYSGIAVLDWSRNGAHQTESFAAQMGADNSGAFTPETLREFIHADDRVRFDEKVFGADAGDGGYDETLKLHNGKRIRMRGARAVDASGALERIVVFLDDVAAGAPASAQKNDALKMAAASLTGAAATVAKAAANDAVPQKSETKVLVTAPVEKAAQSVVDAIDRGELVAAFQPIVCFDTGKVCGAEALLRWPQGEGKNGKTLTTEEIVRQAQGAGKGSKLSAIMMKATADHLAEKVAAGEKDFFGAFNVSLSQVREPGFVEEVKAAIAERKLPKGALVLELTEGEQLGDTPKINETFKKLRAAGASLAYDDFGAGFSSLSNLHKYDFDYLKIDKSFIDDIVANGGKKKIVGALARLGRDFGMTVIAEGIESADAAETAKAIGCRMGQGYHLGQPEVRADAKLEEAPTVSLPGEAEASVPAPEADVLLLDKSLEADAAAPAPGKHRRRLFSSRFR